PVQLNGATQHVVDFATAGFGHLHADDTGLPRGLATCLLVVRQAQVGRLQRAVRAAVLDLLAQLVEFFRSAVATEGMAACQQLLGVLAIGITALTLPVRGKRAADIRAFIPAQAKPAQRIEYRLLGFRRGALLVGVLDAQDELATVLARKAEVEQGDIGGAYVRVTGG